MVEQEPTTASGNKSSDLSSVVIPLMKGVVYQESSPELWNSLLDLQPRVRDYVSVMGLELILDEAEGYAFLRAGSDGGQEETAKRPRLVARRPLSFPVSLLLALLRKKLAESDARGGDTRLVLSREEIVDTIRIFLPSGSNETRLTDQIDSHINKAVDLGFVRPMKGQDGMFEIRRILKAYIDAQWLADFDQRLKEYRSLLAGNGTGAENE